MYPNSTHTLSCTQIQQTLCVCTQIQQTFYVRTKLNKHSVKPIMARVIKHIPYENLIHGTQAFRKHIRILLNHFIFNKKI
jgi:hypothetical protein